MNIDIEGDFNLDTQENRVRTILEGLLHEYCTLISVEDKNGREHTVMRVNDGKNYIILEADIKYMRDEGLISWQSLN